MNFTILKSRPVKIVAIVILVLLLIPELVRFAMIKTVSSMGFGEAVIDDVDVNLFAASVGVEGLSLTREDQQKLTIDQFEVEISWLKLMSGIINVEALSLAGARIEVLETSDGNWDVVIPLTAGSEAEASDPVTESVVLPRIAADKISLNNVSINLKSSLGNGVLMVDSLTLASASTWLQESIELELAGAWNDAPVSVELIANPWDEEARLKGQLRLSRFHLDDFAGLVGRPIAGVVNIDLNFEVLRNTQGVISAGVDGSISLDELAVSYQQLDLNSGEFLWKGKVDVALDDEEFSYLMQADLSSSGLNIVDQQQQISLLAWQNLTLDKLSVDQQLNVSFEQWNVAKVEAIKLDGSDQGRFYVGSGTANDVVLSKGKQLSIDEIEINEGHYQVLITPEGQLQVQGILTTVIARLDQSAEPPASKPEPSVTNDEANLPAITIEQETASVDEEPFTIVLNSLSLSEGTQVRLVDQRFSVPVEQVLNIKTLLVTDVNQLQVDVPVSIELKGSLGEFSSIVLEGEIKPFAEKLWLDIKGELEAIPLPSISPYSEAALGYHLSRGQYDHQFELSINNDDILLENTLFLRQLEVESVDSSKPQPLARQLDIPLGVALDMFRDGDDNIELTVPIKGRMDDPNINISDALNAAFATALKSGATGYLTLALQPYGAVLMAADFAKDQLSAVRLEPMVYEAGVSTLTVEQQDYAEKVLIVLQQRPKLSLTLCGYANDLDKLALEQNKSASSEAELVALAKQRGSELKRLFIKQGVESSRVFICQPSYKADAKAIVEMSM